MNSHQRVLAAIAHQEPDRVPVDLAATPSSGISAIAYANLLNHLGMKQSKVQVYDVVQQLAQPEPAMLDRFGIDVLDVGRTFNARPQDWYDIHLITGQPAQYPAWFHPVKQPSGSWHALKNGKLLAEMPATGTFYDQSIFPWENGYPDKMAGLDDAMSQVLWSAFVHSPWDHYADPGFWETLRNNALQLRSQSDRALMIVCGCNLFEWGTFLRRLDNFCMDLVAEPEQVEALLDALLQRHLAFLEKVCQAVGDVVDICRFGDDLGMDNGPFMSPDTYRQLFKPRHKQLCSYVHKHSRMKTFLHSCGSIHLLLPDLIEAGFDVINPLQTNCLGMDPAQIKKDFGKDVTFWGGGCDTRHVLNRATPQQVKDHVKERLEILSPGGGYVFNTVHNILPDVPPENIVAMYEAVAQFNGG